MGTFPIDDEQLKKVIQQVVAEQALGATAAIKKKVDADSGVISVRTADVEPEPFATGKPEDKVYLSDIFSLEESPRLGCGVMEMKASCFDWILNYDEIDYNVNIDKPDKHGITALMVASQRKTCHIGHTDCSTA